MRIRSITNKILYQIYCKRTHGAMITELLKDVKFDSSAPVIFVESGSGISTISLAEMASNFNGYVYSCDYNEEKINNLKENSGNKLDSVDFLIGDSLDGLKEIATKHEQVHFLFLDSAASAMHTFTEFQIMEKSLKPGAIVLVDNAVIPGQILRLSPARKGKIIVPYLLSSPFWEVTGYPKAGHSMVAAILRKEGKYADPKFEFPDYVDNWVRNFNSHRKLD